MDAVTHTTYRRRDESRGGVGSTLTTWNPRGHEESACLRQSLVLVLMRQGNCDKVIAATEADMGAPPLSRVLPHPSPALECGLNIFWKSDGHRFDHGSCLLRAFAKGTWVHQAQGCLQAAGSRCWRRFRGEESRSEPLAYRCSEALNR